MFAPGGLVLTDGAVALAWAAGYSRSLDAEVAVLDGATLIATFRRAAPHPPGDVRSVDRRGERSAPGALGVGWTAALDER